MQNKNMASTEGVWIFSGTAQTAIGKTKMTITLNDRHDCDDCNCLD